MDTVMDS